MYIFVQQKRLKKTKLKKKRLHILTTIPTIQFKLLGRATTSVITRKLMLAITACLELIFFNTGIFGLVIGNI